MFPLFTWFLLRFSGVQTTGVTNRSYIEVKNNRGKKSLLSQALRAALTATVRGGGIQNSEFCTHDFSIQQQTHAFDSIENFDSGVFWGTVDCLWQEMPAMISPFSNKLVPFIPWKNFDSGVFWGNVDCLWQEIPACKNVRKQLILETERLLLRNFHSVHT